jgi:hypothetical protein
MAKQAFPQTDAVAYWTDEDGLVHICESIAPLSNELLVWTLCDREVESGAGFIPSTFDAVTCGKCTAAEGLLKRRASAHLQTTLR